MIKSPELPQPVSMVELDRRPSLETGRYDAEGNRLLVVLDMNGFSPEVTSTLARAVDREGMDSAILLTPPFSPHADFRMRVVEKDGSLSNMCGNGVRAAAKFAHDRFGQPEVRLETSSGEIVVGKKEEGDSYSARLSEIKDLSTDASAFKGLVADRVLEMEDAVGYVQSESFESAGASVRSITHILGEPHMIVDIPGDMTRPFLTQTAQRLIDLRTEDGIKVFPVGINVNFVGQNEDSITVLTYERGVNAFTGSCGTGSICSAKDALQGGRTEIDVMTLAGALKVGYDGEHYRLQGRVDEL